jgi:ribosome maturation factor RimP
MLTEPLAGRRNFKGELRALEPAGPDEGSGDVLVMEVDGNEFRLPLAGIASARLVPDWDSLMRGNRGGDRTPGRPGSGRPG